MSLIQYLQLSEVSRDELVAVLNDQKVRAHLMAHPLFDADNVQPWIESKLQMDATPGCRVRAIVIEDRPVGWCGIQLEDGQYEIAIILDDRFWGLGKRVFQEIMLWARELGHAELLVHFLHTRPEYKFLRKMSKKVYDSELYGNKFRTYQLEVG